MSDLISTEEEIKLDLCWGSFEVWPSCSFRCSVESFQGFSSLRRLTKKLFISVKEHLLMCL